MEQHYFKYRFNSYFLPLLSMESSERNNIFKNMNINDIYDLIYLSAGICEKNNIFIINNSLKILNKYLLFIKHCNTKNQNYQFINFLEHIYIFLTNYDYINKDNNEIFEEINYKIEVYKNIENFKNYINNSSEISNILYNLCQNSNNTLHR